MISYYVGKFLFLLKYKLGLAKPGVDFVDVFDPCSCQNILEDCCEDCGVCPFYHPDGF